MKRKPYSRAGHAIWGPWAVRCWWFLKLWPLQGVKASVIFFPQDLCQNWGQRLLYYYYNTYITHISYIYICTINDIIYANAIIHSISVIYIYHIYHMSYLSTLILWTEAFLYASAELRSDRDFVLEMLALNPGSMQGASAEAGLPRSNKDH